MADSREPPPLFNDDDDSHKDDDNDDLFTSAVQSPVSEQTTPEDCRRQEGGGNPLTSPPPAVSLTPDPPAGVHPDLFESCEEPTEGGFSSVPLEQPHGEGGMQQVSTEAQDPAASPLPSLSSSAIEDPLSSPTPSAAASIAEEHSSIPPPSTALSTAKEFPSGTPPSTISSTAEEPCTTTPLSTESIAAEEYPSNPPPSSLSSDTEESLTVPNSSLSASAEEQPSVPLSSTISSLTDDPLPTSLLSAFSSTYEESSPTLQTSNSEQEFPGSPPPTPTSGAHLDHGMILPQELSSELSTTLIDVPSVGFATTSGLVAPAEEASLVDTALNDSANLTNDDIFDDQSPYSNDVHAAADSASNVPDVPAAALELGTDPTFLHDAQNFLGDGDTTEISLDDHTQEVSLEEEADEGELFDTSSAPKLQLNQDPVDHPVPVSSILPPMGAPMTPPVAPITPAATPNVTPSITPAAPTPVTPVVVSRPSAEQLESESGDEFIQITVSDPQKIGEGMSAYMAYKVTTKTNVSFFRKKHWSVMRRFSDFLGLHRKLVEKHLHSGRIIPPAPEKSAIGTTKIKLSSEKSADSASADFIEKRRASLERYMNRTAVHSALRADPDFREFIELDAELPRATQTSALSSAGVLRLFNKMGATVNKMTFKMDESDQWYEEKTQQIESLDAQLRKLHAAMEGLVAYRRELATSTAAFAKSTAVLSSVEEHSSLNRALHQLAESTERTHTIHHAQADADFYWLSENTKDYIQLIGAVKDVFHERVKTFQIWQHAQATLAKKREAKAKAEIAGRMDKVQQAQEEVAEWELKVERSQEEFERISRAIKKEVEQFDVVRVKDFKEMVVKYLEALMTSQQQIIKVWETFLPEAKAIA
ncbi:uncharacterized protein [Panulirus ornatus]|uniref:uncharacterized protein isoform X1 n=1 Tax=Panulirus ornatus TaxID=150431 RepID=UPI003A884D4C